MGPRLLRNFTRDGGNQFALGVFVSTFAYARLVLEDVERALQAPRDIAQIRLAYTCFERASLRRAAQLWPRGASRRRCVMRADAQL